MEKFVNEFGPLSSTRHLETQKILRSGVKLSSSGPDHRITAGLSQNDFASYGKMARKEMGIIYQQF